MSDYKAPFDELLETTAKLSRLLQSWKDERAIAIRVNDKFPSYDLAARISTFSQCIEGLEETIK